MLKDFAAFATAGNTAIDPTLAYVISGSQLTSGGVDQPWVRPYVTFVPDRDAKFISIGARVTTPNEAAATQEHLNAQYFTKWQLERAQSTFLPRAYTPAREIQVVVNPDRLNLVPNPSLETNATGWSNSTNATVARSTTQAAVGTASLSLTSVAAGLMTAVVSTAQRAIVVENREYTAQAKFRAATASRPTRVRIFWYNSGGGLISSPTGVAVNDSNTGWTNTQLTATAPAGAVTAAVGLTVDSTAGAGEVHYADSIILETGNVAGPYFDGSFGDDYLWESGEVAHNARSYYYENRLDRGEVLKRALRDAVPLGIGVGVAQFAVFTG